MQTDNTTAVQTSIDLACLFANPLLNSGQSTLARLAMDVSLTVFSRAVLTDEVDGALKIEALKSFLSNSTGLDNYKQEFYNFLANDDFSNLKTLLTENNVVWQIMENSLPSISAQWAQSNFGWGVRFNKDMVLTNNNAQKQALYALLENPPADFYETFFYNKAITAVERSNMIVAKAQHINQGLLNDIASNNFLSVADVQAKIQERRNVVSGSAPAYGFPPGPE